MKTELSNYRFSFPAPHGVAETLIRARTLNEAREIARTLSRTLNGHATWVTFNEKTRHGVPLANKETI